MDQKYYLTVLFGILGVSAIISITNADVTVVPVDSRQTHSGEQSNQASSISSLHQLISNSQNQNKMSDAPQSLQQFGPQNGPQIRTGQQVLSLEPAPYYSVPLPLGFYRQNPNQIFSNAVQALIAKQLSLGRDAYVQNQNQYNTPEQDSNNLYLQNQNQYNGGLQQPDPQNPAPSRQNPNSYPQNPNQIVSNAGQTPAAKQLSLGRASYIQSQSQYNGGLQQPNPPTQNSNLNLQNPAPYPQYPNQIVSNAIQTAVKQLLLRRSSYFQNQGQYNRDEENSNLYLQNQNQYNRDEENSNLYLQNQNQYNRDEENSNLYLQNQNQYNRDEENSNLYLQNQNQYNGAVETPVAKQLSLGRGSYIQNHSQHNTREENSNVYLQTQNQYNGGLQQPDPQNPAPSRQNPNPKSLLLSPHFVQQNQNLYTTGRIRNLSRSQPQPQPLQVSIRGCIYGPWKPFSHDIYC